MFALIWELVTWVRSIYKNALIGILIGIFLDMCIQKDIHMQKHTYIHKIFNYEFFFLIWWYSLNQFSVLWKLNTFSKETGMTRGRRHFWLSESHTQNYLETEQVNTEKPVRRRLWQYSFVLIKVKMIFFFLVEKESIFFFL